MFAHLAASRSWLASRARVYSTPQCGNTMRMSAFLRASRIASLASSDLQGRAPGPSSVAPT